jgi:cytoskeletal protein RodZ
MNKSLKIALIVVISIILITTIVIFAVVYFTQDRKDQSNTNSVMNVNSSDNTNQSANTNTAGSNTNANSNTNASPTSDVNASTETMLKPIAKNFTERFGSYSSDSNFENITKLEIYMSASLKKWAEKYVEEQRESMSSDDPYFGITTKALSITVDSVNEESGKAEFTVSTQRNQVKEGEETEVIYQNIKLKFITEDGGWKVNEANWL